MKKAAFIFLFLLPLIMWAQKIQTFKGTYSDYLKGIWDCNMTYSYYYDDKDNKVRHGALSINGSQSGEMDNKKLTVSCSYVHGKLNGTLTENYNFSRNLAKISYGWHGYWKQISTLSANYKNGVLNGELKATKNETHPYNGDEKGSYTFTYSNGELKSSVINGVYRSWDDKGRMTGKDEEDGVTYHIKNGIATNYYKRKSGAVSEIDASIQTTIINNYISTGIIDTALCEKNGYWFDFYSFTANIDLFKKMMNTELNIWFFDKDFKFPSVHIDYYVLRKVNLVSYENLVGLYEESVQHNYQNVDKFVDEIRDNLNGGWWLASDTITKFIPFFEKRQAEIEQARIEAEKKAEAERIAAEQARIAAEQKKEEVKSLMTNITNNIDAINNKCTEIKKGYSGIFISTEEKVKVKKGYEQVYEQFTKVVGPFADELMQKGYEYFSDSDISYARKVREFTKSFIDNVVDGTMVQKIQNNYSQIEQICGKEYADVSKSYSHIYETYDLTPVFSSLEEYDAYILKLNNILIEQNCCLRFIQLRKQAVQNSAKIIETAGKDFSDVVMSYGDFDKGYDVSFVQDTVSDWKRMNDLFFIQQNCLKFIELRKQISSTNAEILAQGKVCKNITKVYSAYFKSVDMTWGSDANADQKLQTIIATQEIFKNAVTGDNATKLDTAVKKSKDKSINAILEIIR